MQFGVNCINMTLDFVYLIIPTDFYID